VFAIRSDPVKTPRLAVLGCLVNGSTLSYVCRWRRGFCGPGRVLSPKSDRRAACGRRRLWLCVLALVVATFAICGWTSLAAGGQAQNPTRLWSEYPLDAAGGGIPASPVEATRGSDQSPARAASTADVLGQELVRKDEEALRPWALSLAIFAGFALAGMGWDLMLLRRDSHWKEPAAPRRQRSRPPVVVSSSNGSAAAKNGTTSIEKPPAAAGGIRYRD
jgi:hypothetical protein